MNARRWLIIAVFAIAIGPCLGVARAGAASHSSEPTPTSASLQVALHVLGYDPGLIDGLIGRRTVAALAAYAQDRRIVLNQATAELVVMLLVDEASEALRQDERDEEPLRGRSLGMLPVYQW